MGRVYICVCLCVWRGGGLWAGAYTRKSFANFLFYWFLCTRKTVYYPCLLYKFGPFLRRPHFDIIRNSSSFIRVSPSRCVSAVVCACLFEWAEKSRYFCHKLNLHTCEALQSDLIYFQDSYSLTIVYTNNKICCLKRYNTVECDVKHFGACDPNCHENYTGIWMWLMCSSCVLQPLGTF